IVKMRNAALHLLGDARDDLCVLRVISRGDECECRANARLELVDTIELFGPGEFARRRIKQECAGETRLLALRQKALALAQRLLGTLAILDIDPDRIPSDNVASLVVQRNAVRCVPAILAISAPYPRLGDERLPRRQRSAPCPIKDVGIVRVEMRECLCAWARRLFQREPHVLLPGPVD